MRDPGWYWVKYAIGTPWECARFTEYGRWDMHGREDRSDDYLFLIGHKIEEPEDEV
jgi:hypothetical protein